MSLLGKRIGADQSEAVSILESAYFNQSSFLAWLAEREIPTYGTWDALNAFLSEWRTERDVAAPPDSDLERLEESATHPEFWTGLRAAANLARKQRVERPLIRHEQRVYALEKERYAVALEEIKSTLYSIAKLAGVSISIDVPSRRLDAVQFRSEASKTVEQAEQFAKTNRTGNINIDTAVDAQVRLLRNLVGMFGDAFKLGEETAPRVISRPVFIARRNTSVQETTAVSTPARAPVESMSVDESHDETFDDFPDVVNDDARPSDGTFDWE